MNTKHYTPNLPVIGARNESATTLTPGMAVVQGTAEDQVTIGAADAKVKGIVALDQNAAQGDGVSIHVGHGGIVYVQAGAAFAKDTDLSINNAGLWITSASTKRIQARSLSAAANAGELIPAIIYDGNSVTA
jgi:hypothetical protein